MWRPKLRKQNDGNDSRHRASGEQCAVKALDARINAAPDEWR
jgi:hypothetical protein